MSEPLKKLRRISERIRKLVWDEPADLLKPQADGYLAGQAISRHLLRRSPFLASRIGWTEASCIGTFLKNGRKPDAVLQERIWRYSGVYPATAAQFEAFVETYLQALGEVDLLGTLCSPFEKQLVETFGKKPILTELSSLEPYFCPEPWSQHLAGLRVLVIHPFVDSIRSQYENRRRELFVNPKVLPEFTLVLVRAPQTIAGNAGELPSWTDALNRMKDQVSREEFDAAIVGCGAYGLPIGAFVRGLGKPCIHIGGATQILFGVTGTRWRESATSRALETPAWSSPLESERPPNWRKVEDGCYW